MKRRLLSPATAQPHIAKFLMDNTHQEITLFVTEDKVFKDGHRLDIGTLDVKPDPETSEETGIEYAIAHGFYEIATPTLESLTESVIGCLRHEETAESKGKGGDSRNSRIDKQNAKAVKALHFIPSIFARVGLTHPPIDIDTIARLPLTAPATIVTDTSAILSGGLDFIRRFMYPHARVKVPGIVSMEIVSSVDNYFSQRRQETPRPGDLLLSHLKGIGGQRVLLRLELREDFELERTAIFHEPLRHAFKKDTEVETNVDVTAVVRSYADRLVLESARQHQVQVSPGHPVYIMTSDQGLSRMALAEGFKPIFCDTFNISEFFPLVLTGVNFAPFQPKLYGVPLTSLIWELAVCFGCAGLQSESGAYIDVAALGRDLPWQPFHSQEDLLWFRQASGVDIDENGSPLPNLLSSTEASAVQAGELADAASGSSNSAEQRDARRGLRNSKAPVALEVRDSEWKAGSAFYKFSAGGLLKIIGLLFERAELELEKAAQLVAVKEGQVRNYNGFLRAGGFVSVDGSRIVKTDSLDLLYQAMRSRDTRQVEALLRRVPSFDGFIVELEDRRVISGEELRQSVFWRLPNYRRYGEAVARMILIPDEGLFSTPSDPSVEEFAKLAVQAHLTIGGSASEYVLTGAWLEELVRTHGVHPIVARDRLGQAEAARLLNRFTRGATPDTRFENHEFHTIEPAGGAVDLVPVALYHGNFLIPERTSVELRIEGLEL